MRPEIDVKSLHAKIGQLSLDNDFFGRSAREGRFVVPLPGMTENLLTISVASLSKRTLIITYHSGAKFKLVRNENLLSEFKSADSRNFRPQTSQFVL
jgi:hypothetical protein